MNNNNQKENSKSSKKTKNSNKNSNSKSNSNNNKSNPSLTNNPLSPNSYPDNVIADNFVVLNKIGAGAFGEIYLSYSLRDQTEVAVKKELKKNQKYSQLKNESKIYQTLLNISTGIDISGKSLINQETVLGVPKFYGVGESLLNYYMIMEFLGPNLFELLRFCKTKKFTKGTVSLIALQLLNRIENLHKHNYIHRDIKPENFVIGTEQKSNIINLKVI